MSANELNPDAREREIFLQALDHDGPAERAAFLENACGGNAHLRAAVEALLANHRADSFLEAPAGGAGQTVRLEPGIVAPVTETPGDRIGRYKLLEKLGEGGFGAVWAAEQKEPVRRRVALKIIKLGMDTRQVVARFEAERQALALMDHPNIAKVLDAGATDNGRPYFVMELVRGIRITDYCEQNQLAASDRLDLFIKVCHAVQHAHQKGIIHRDIKPSNILVTLHDGVPVPKVIDFGIAKATQADLTDKTIYTQFQQFIGTPAYMSPEQAEMSGLDLDTRSDIYSLGVLLYELLTGKTPFDGAQLLASGVDEMRRILREVEPVRPSTRLTQELARMGSARVPRAESGVAPDSRATHPNAREGRQGNEVFGGTPKTARETRALPEHLRTLINALRGDLDWIVMKCIEKDRTRRYETANGLAMDLQRHLKNEPVVARPPSAAYRIQKFARRNKVGVSAGALLLLLLVAGVIGTSLGLLRAERERRRAFAAATRATAASTEAQRARDLAEDNARELERNLYFNRVALAHRELTAEPRNIRDAEQLLELCPQEMRHWEWHYLKRLRHTEPLALREPASLEVYGIAFSPDDRHLASASGDGKVRIWDLDRRQSIQTLPAHTNFASCVAFHPMDAGSGIRQGAELFYLSGRALMSVALKRDSRLQPGEPTKVFDLPDSLYIPSESVESGNPFDVSADGQRFLMMQTVESPGGSRPAVLMVENWFEEFREKQSR